MAAQVMGQPSSATALFDAALSGGLAASGQALGGIAVGQRADFCVLDAQSPALLGIPSDHVLDALVFSSPDARFDAVYVAGQAAHTQGDARFTQTMHALWGG
jgi:formimidoylglutamate deiminase